MQLHVILKVEKQQQQPYVNLLATFQNGKTRFSIVTLVCLMCTQTETVVLPGVT